MRTILAGLAVLLLSGCSTLPTLASVQSAAKPSSGAAPRCVSLFVAALTSTRPVNGAFACQSDHLKAAAAKAGINNDADLATMAAQPPQFSNPRYLGRMPDGNGYEYLVTIDGTSHPLFVWADSGGHPDSFQYVP